MRKVLLISMFALMAFTGYSQFTLVPSVSNYHLTWTTINPAFSGFRDAISVSSVYRSRLYGEQGPLDMQLNMHTPVGNSKVAIGAVIAYNNTPSQNMYNIMTTYAYRIYLGRGRLSFGLSAGMYGLNSSLNSVDTRDQGDPLFTLEAYQRWYPNFGTGVLYYTDKFFVGLSVPELLSVDLKGESIASVNVEDYRVILSGAYLFDISKAFRLKPSVMIDYNKASTSFKASMNVGLMDSRIFFGGAYHHPNFAIALLNFQVNRQFLLGYAYTFNVGELSAPLGGSHEVVLRWELKPVVKTIPDDPFYF